jgi:hypothetical protein
VNISGDLPSELGVNQIQCDPYDSNTLFAATDYGLYFTTNGGAEWEKENRIPNVRIEQLKLRISDRRLFAVTYGRGIWYMTLGTGSEPFTSVPKSPPVLSFGIYPNPVKDEVSITFAHAPTGLVDLELHSIEGKLLHKETRINTGQETMRLDMGRMPGGVYLLRVQNGYVSGTKKLIKQ